MVNLEAQLSRGHQGTLGWAKVSSPPAWEVAKESHWWQLGCYCFSIGGGWVVIVLCAQDILRN